MAHNSEVFQKVVERLSKMTGPQFRALPISEDTEIYGDLKIYGDEIVDLVWWLEKEFRVATNIDPFLYAPGETPFFGIVMGLKRILGFRPQYKSLKVRDIVAAVELKRWPAAPEGVVAQ